MTPFNKMLRRDSERYTRWLGGEPIPYYQINGDSVIAVTVFAIVRYLVPESVQLGTRTIESAPGNIIKVEIEFPVDARYGVMQVNKQSDMVLIPKQIGEQPTPHTVWTTNNQDPGMWVLGLHPSNKALPF